MCYGAGLYLVRDGFVEVTTRRPGSSDRHESGMRRGHSEWPIHIGRFVLVLMLVDEVPWAKMPVELKTQMYQVSRMGRAGSGDLNRTQPIGWQCLMDEVFVT